MLLLISDNFSLVGKFYYMNLNKNKDLSGILNFEGFDLKKFICWIMPKLFKKNKFKSLSIMNGNFCYHRNCYWIGQIDGK
jgi:hypothetical protein